MSRTIDYQKLLLYEKIFREHSINSSRAKQSRSVVKT